MNENTAASYADILQHQSRVNPERTAFTFLADGEEEAGRLTFAELDRQARTIGRALQEAGAAGERVLLLFPSGLEYVAAFLGCLYGGAVAVPVYPPRQRRHLERLLAIVRDARPAAALTTAAQSETLRSWGERVPELAGLRWIATDALDAGAAGAWTPPPADRDGLAFLQYTSGSTGDPKGVMVRHGDLLHNEEAIRRAFGQGPESVVVGWLPLYHDMGLIGSVLQPLYSGGSCVLMSPMAFLQRPVRWLQAISRYRATTSGGPDFAYDLCARKVRPEEREALDLRSWEVAFDGAEPVRAATLERFAAAFAPYGFRASSFVPCYGLAEGTLLVSGGRSAAGPVVRGFSADGLESHRAETFEGEGGRRLVGCGEPAAGQEVLAVDPETAEPCEPGRVGELWVRGPSVAGGYWNRPEESAAVFRARLASGEGPFLRTGDLGFLDGGQLFVTGRIKDLIILRGRNLYPQDVERAAETAHPALRPGAAAAFAVFAAVGVEREGEERLVLACELEPRVRLEPAGAEIVGEAVRRAVFEACEARVEELVLLAAGALPRTSSGKVRRAACRELYREGRLETVARIAGPAGEEPAWIDESGGDERSRVLGWLVARVAAVAKADPGRVTAGTSLAALGVDSLAAVEVRNRVEEELGIDLPLSLLLGDATLGELADRALSGGVGARPRPAPASAPSRAPLSWGQRPLWFLQQLAPDSPAANLAVALRLRSSVDAVALRRALESLADRHAALRTTFPAPGGEPVQEIGPGGGSSPRGGGGLALGGGQEGGVARIEDGGLRSTPLLASPRFQPPPPRGEEPAHPGSAAKPALMADLPGGRESQPAGAASQPAGAESQPAGMGSLPAGAASPPAGAASLPAGVAGRPAGAASLPAGADNQPAGKADLPAGAASPEATILDRILGEVETGGRDLQALLDGEANRPFALDRERPWRALLVRAPGEDPVLLLVAHHIAVDFWSFVVLLEELDRLYPGIAAGRAPELPPAPGPAEWAAELAADLAGPEGERLWSFWRDELGPEPAAPELPADRPRPARPSHAAGTLNLSLEPGVAEGLMALARSRHTTLYVTLLAAFQTLLARYSASGEPVVASPAAGRVRGRWEGTVGYLMNPLPLRARLGGDPAFGEALERTRAAVLAALEHQLFPSHLIAERLQAGGVERPELFRVGFVHNRPHRLGGELGRLGLGEGGVALRLGGIEAESVALARRASLFDLMLSTAEGNGGLHARFEASTDLFDAATVERLAGHWRTLLSGIAADPGRRLSDLPLLTGEERAQLLGDWSGWSGAGAPPVEGAGVHERFQRLAALSPEAPAVRHGDRVLTYGELDRQARRLASWLRRRGIEAEVPVGVCLPRSPELLVAFFGVLHAGSVWLPLDPAWPAERKALLLAEAGAALCLDELPESTEDSEPARVDPAQAACILFTSGSTGLPKGVVVEHGALLSYVDTAAALYGTGPEDRVLQFSALTFDISLEEIGIALTRGACLVLRDEESARSPEALVDLCSRHRITVASLPTTAWHELAEALRGDHRERLTPPPDLRLVVLGGERVLAERLAAWREHAPGTRVINTYGPLEAVVACTQAEVAGPAAEPLSAAGEVSIGRPLPCSRVYLLDRHLAPVPVGVPGEICVAGRLARGYLGAAPTAERFVPDPLAERPGGRLYRTGDLGRRRPDGTLEFVGRVDRQVKVRGFRVEPEEIETVLVRHPAVREAAVVAVPAAAGGHRLVAWVVGDAPARELRAFLAERLPEFLVPSTLAALDALPRNAHGKVDRRALPDPGGVRPDLAEPFVEPAGPVEEVVAGVCASVLGIDRVGARDDLFELGCHSLLAARIVARLREALQVELPLVSLFEAPTVAGLAARVEASRAEAALPPIRPVPRDRPLPLSFSQERLWFLGRLDPESASYHVPRAIRMRGPLPVARVAAAWTELVRRHEILRTTFPLAEDGPVQVVHPPAPVPVPLIDLQGLASEREAELQRWIRSEGARPFDVERGPLLRVRLFRLAPEEHLLLLTEHHLVHDGWTEGMLLRDFVEIYSALAAGRPAALPELPVQFADFAVWQREWLRGEVLERQLAWWTGHLAGAPELLELPADRPRPAVQSQRGAAHRFQVPAELAAGLRRLSRRRGVTLYMTFLAVFQTMLWRITGREDLVIGTGIANRRRREIEGMLGMVINTLALRTRLDGEPPFAGLLERVRRVCLGAYANQDLPFEKVVEALKPARSLSYNPLFQVMFGFQDTPHPDLALPGLALEALEAHNRSTKFDLMMLVLPEAEQAVGLREHRDDSPITIEIEYATDLFDGTTALRLAGAYAALLEGIVADPERGLAGLPFLSAAQRHQLLVEWSRGPEPGMTASSALALFEERAARSPEALAVVAGTEEIGYGELDRRASRIAGRLRAVGIGPEARVALLAGRGAALPAAILGIWKAGGVFVPVDPSLPAARLALLLEDFAVTALVTEETLLDRVAALPLDGVALVVADGGAEDGPASSPSPAALACLVPGLETVMAATAVMVEHGPPEPGLMRRGAAILHGTAEAAFLAGEDGSATGRPLPGVELLVSGPGGQPAPVGVPGELRVSGPGLALGYLDYELDREDLTAERFVESGGRRWFRVEGRARWLADGRLELLDRVPEGGAEQTAGPGRDRPAFQAPRTEIEQGVAAIWSELLHRDRVGVFDSFFDLGGHSLLVTQALSRLRSRFGVEVPVRDLFEEPTVANVARLIEELRLRAAAAEAEDELSLALAELDGLSDEEVERLLAGGTGEEPA